jgi:hypothetical protein
MHGARRRLERTQLIEHAGYGEMCIVMRFPRVKCPVRYSRIIFRCVQVVVTDQRPEPQYAVQLYHVNRGDPICELVCVR